MRRNRFLATQRDSRRWVKPVQVGVGTILTVRDRNLGQDGFKWGQNALTLG